VQEVEISGQNENGSSFSCHFGLGKCEMPGKCAKMTAECRNRCTSQGSVWGAVLRPEVELVHRKYWLLGCGKGPEVLICAQQRVRRDVVRRFVAAATSSSDRIGVRRTVGGDGETSGRRRGRAGSAATAAPRATLDGPPTDS